MVGTSMSRGAVDAATPRALQDAWVTEILRRGAWLDCLDDQLLEAWSDAILTPAELKRLRNHGRFSVYLDWRVLESKARDPDSLGGELL